MHHSIVETAGLVCTQQANSNVPARAVDGFKLHAGRAMSLTPNMPGELRIAHGRVWVTFSHAADEATVRAGDHFLGAGDLLRLLPGQQLVMEAYEKGSCDAVYFSWEPDAAPSKLEIPRRAAHAHAGVRQPLLDLGAALHQAGSALGWLTLGLGSSLSCMVTRCDVTAR